MCTMRNYPNNVIVPKEMEVQYTGHVIKLKVPIHSSADVCSQGAHAGCSPTVLLSQYLVHVLLCTYSFSELRTSNDNIV